MENGARPLLCFSHLQKAGGTTIEAVLRRHFGLRHMLVHPRRGWLYDARDLAFDLRLNPLTRSICSHWLRPFADMGEFEDRLVWYTVLRRPIPRFLSHYQHHVEKMSVTTPFHEWIRNPIQQNWMTRFLVGEPDVEAAKQVLAERYRFVGLLERFDESLLLMRERLGLDGMRVSYGRPRNTAKSKQRREALREQFDRLRDDVLELNRLDLELYEYASKELYPRQVEEYGAERLSRDLEAFSREEEPTLGDRVREKGYLLFRRAVHLPSIRIREALAERRGEPDIRR